MNFGKNLRLLKSNDFKLPKKYQKKIEGNIISLYFCPRELRTLKNLPSDTEPLITFFDKTEDHSSEKLCSRIGLVISRKCGKANVRNKTKRLIREWFRCDSRLRFLGLDLVFVFKQNAKMKNKNSSINKNLHRPEIAKVSQEKRLEGLSTLIKDDLKFFSQYFHGSRFNKCLEK